MIRVKLLSAGRLIALGAFVAIATALVVYLVIRNRRVEGDQARPKLQGRVVAIFYNTRYAHEVEGRIRFVITSGVDKTYEDGTHELEQVKLESFGASGTRHDIVTADIGKVSDPSDLAKLDAEFVNNVVVQTNDETTIKTNYLHYDQPKNTVDTQEYVEFEGRNFSGHSTGIFIEIEAERVHLLKDVEVTLNPQSKTGEQASDNKSKDKNSKNDQSTLKEPTNIKGDSALLEKKDRRVTFDGNVAVIKGSDEMRADKMTSYFGEENRIERIEARGNSYLKQTDKGEVKAADIDFFFGDDHKIARAVATGGVYTRSLAPDSAREARASTMEITFTDGVADTIKAQGSAVVQVHAPATTDNKTNPTERELSSDAMTISFFADGKNIKSVEATGNALLVVTPVRAERGADKKAVRAPQMNADFYEQDNRIKTANAIGGVRIDIEATLANAHPPRVVTSKTAMADFLADSQDVERINLNGDVKYTEGDRNGVAEHAYYDGQKEIVNLRGERPMAWDSKSRTQADEIDYDRKADEIHARGDVRTTYYSRESTNDSTPFKNTKSPIFMTAERADARNNDGYAVYTGNARGWQDDNFVKGDKIELYQNDKRMVATGHVESALYKAKRDSSSGKSETVPGFATAERMTYSDTDRVIHYEGNVKARQGTDRIEAAVIDAYLQKEANELDHLTADGNVVLTQPGRRGTGDHLDYTSAEGRAILKGKTARIEDREKGSTMGTQLTFYNRDDKIAVENQQGTGRVRSTHRLTKNK
ncbi:MAG TPA: LPS export ABC transporter periplasmic protein LptC [Blastocatellia bacterium]|nr:LPS export ABC transporter periplasmic protein LptC [Blastocatellia bacterium]